MKKLMLHLLLISSLLFATTSRAESPQAGVFDYYLLTLSWSPAFCLTHQDNNQCNKGYGFVLHGLWPQYTNGRWPENCAPQTPLSQQDRAYGNTLFPSDRLLTHEWNKHGSCSGLGASAYLAAADRAMAAIIIPDAFQAPIAPLYMSLSQILAAFHTRNAGLPTGAIVTICHGSDLAEVRICQDKNHVAQTCPPSVKSQCQANKIRIINAR